MAEHLSSFNSGQLSPLLDQQDQLDVYRSGCKILRNMYVKPQGGVERRQGTRYLLEALSDDSRLIPFIFTRDVSYMIELDATGIRLLDTDGSVIDELSSPYTSDDIKDIKYTQVGDILWMVCPNKKPYQLKRTNINPITFVMEEVPFSYPPLLPVNRDVDSRMYFQPVSFDSSLDYAINSQVQEGGIFYTNPAPVTAGAFNVAEWDVFTEETYITSGSRLNIYSNNGEFNDGIQDGFFRVSHQRASEEVLLNGEIPETSAPVYSDWAYVGNTGSFNNIDLFQHTSWAYLTTDIETKEGVGGAVTTLSTHTHVGDETIRVDGTSHTYCRLKMNTTGLALPQGWIRYSITKFNPVRVSFTSDSASIAQSNELDVSFSNWTITTSDSWTGSVEIEKSVNGGIWTTLTKITDTAGMSTTAGETTNVTFTSPSKEGANTKIRIKFHWTFGTIKCVLENDTIKSEGLLRIDEYIDENNVVATVVNNLLNNKPTSVWSEGAFNSYRGYPSTITLIQERVSYSGTITEPNTVYISHTNDYYNFLLGANASDAIKVTPTSNEPATWLLSKGNALYQGTRGSVIVYKSYDNKALSPSNISSSVSLEFGGSTIQAISTNETVVFLERLNSKLRETFYSDEEHGLVSRDLTVMSNEIAGHLGFTELVLQKSPDQIIFGLREDGLVSGLTYERSQNVIGWSEFDFGGKVLSIGVRPTSTHDELWVSVKRENGTYIEKQGSRLYNDDLLDAWYVDSGIIGQNPSIDGQNVELSDDAGFPIIVGYTGTVVNDSTITLTNVDTFTSINNRDFMIKDVDTGANTFKLADVETGTLINWVEDYMPPTVGHGDEYFTLSSITDGYPLYSDTSGQELDGKYTQSWGNTSIEDMTNEGLESWNYYGTIWYSDDGLNFLGSDSARVSLQLYALSTPFDLSTRTLIDANDVYTDIQSIDSNQSGTKIIIGGGSLIQYNLGTPWHFTTATPNHILNSAQSFTSVQWNGDGTKLLTTNKSSDTTYDIRIYQTASGRTYDIDGMTLIESEVNISTESGSAVKGAISDDNLTLLITERDGFSDSTISEYDITSFSLVGKTFNISKTVTSISSLSLIGTTLRCLRNHPAVGGVTTYDLPGGVSSRWVIRDTGGTIIDSNVSRDHYPLKTGWIDDNTRSLSYNMEISDTITADIGETSNVWSSLDHLEGETVQVVGNGGYLGDYPVINGSITTTLLYNQVVIGLQYYSVLQPMFIGSSNYPSSGRDSTILNTVFRFYRSLGGYTGVLIQNEDRDPVLDFEDVYNDFPNMDRQYYEIEPLTFRRYNDTLGDIILPFTGTKKSNFNDTTSRVKTQFIITGDPLPMTVLGMIIDLKLAGD